MTDPQLTSYSVEKAVKAFPLRLGTRMSTLVTFIQHSFRSPSHSNQRRKKGKGVQVGKEK